MKRIISCNYFFEIMIKLFWEALKAGCNTRYLDSLIKIVISGTATSTPQWIFGYQELDSNLELESSFSF